VTERPLCTVIVPTYNRCELLRLTLESLTRQTLPAERFEVIVVDDGSSDATVEVTEAFRDRLRLSYFFQPDEGFRVAGARNIGIREAAGEVCVFIDSGVIAASTCIAAHAASHQVPGIPAAVCGYVFGFDQGDEDAQQIRESLDPQDPDGAIAEMRTAERWADIRERFYQRHPDLGRLPAPWVVYWTCNASARTSQLAAVGMFDESYLSWGGEDIDLGYRLYRDGATFVLNREAVAIHWPHEKNREANRRSSRENYARFTAKYADPIVQLLATEHLMELNDAILAGRIPGAEVAPPGGQ
jgi:glycosyltransferase involved in cell wall biosynthesis